MIEGQFSLVKLDEPDVMSRVKWPINSSHCTICWSVVHSSMQKLWTPLATIFVEKKIEKNFGVVLDPFELPHERNFWYLEKNGVMKIFERVQNPEPVIHGLIYLSTWLKSSTFFLWKRQKRSLAKSNFGFSDVSRYN